ncbi:hypothetical protein IMAU30002_01962 [Lactobacillus helveticus]|nr:hypothetical protein [Lactobacillus helveticus]
MIVSEQADQLMALIPSKIIHTQINHKTICLMANSDEAFTLLLKFRSFIKTFNYQDGTMDDAFLALTGRRMR